MDVNVRDEIYVLNLRRLQAMVLCREQFLESLRKAAMFLLFVFAHSAFVRFIPLIVEDYPIEFGWGNYWIFYNSFVIFMGVLCYNSSRESWLELYIKAIPLSICPVVTVFAVHMVYYIYLAVTGQLYLTLNAFYLIPWLASAFIYYYLQSIAQDYGMFYLTLLDTPVWDRGDVQNNAKLLQAADNFFNNNL